MVSEAISTSLTSEKKVRQRRRELFSAFAAFVLIILLSLVELRFFGVNSYVFLAIFNVNLILLLVVLFLVLRNVVKLFLDRKRNVRGARLRLRLVWSFVLLSIIPTLLMFIVSIKFVQTSVDYWFKSKVDSSMEQALEVGKTYYDNTQKQLKKEGLNIIESIRSKEFLWGAPGMDNFLQEKSQEYGLSLIGVVSPALKEQNWHASQKWEDNWDKVKKTVAWKKLKDSPEFWSKFLSASKEDLVVGIVPVDEAKTGFLVLGKTIEQGLLTKMDNIVQGVKEYKQLKNLKQPLKIALYIILGVMTLLIIFGAMWFGLRLAKEITAPVQALSLGTQRIAHGDLGVRVDDDSEDELGFLVQSFNTMAEDLEQSQNRLNKANEDLANQNLELEQRRKYMEAVMNNITSGVISLDRQDRISTVNKAAEETLATQAELLIGYSPFELLDFQYSKMIQAAVSQLKESPHTHWQRQIDLQIGDQERKLLVNAVGLRTDYGENIGTVMVFEDVTELDKMQRMAAWREVARRIAHEIKNPLTPIKLSAQRLEKKFGQDQEGDSLLESTRLIIRQVEHLQQMVKEFSSFAKLPDVNPVDNHLPPLLEEVINLFQNSHAHITWELDIDNHLPKFKFDWSAMRRVFINLLTNASEVLKSEPDPVVNISADYDEISHFINIHIKDNGPGFEKDEQLRMFEPYYSKKKGNTGLGLTIVKAIVNDHRGYVRVKSNQPRGSIFIVELPV